MNRIFDLIDQGLTGGMPEDSISTVLFGEAGTGSYRIVGVPSEVRVFRSLVINPSSPVFHLLLPSDLVINKGGLFVPSLPGDDPAMLKEVGVFPSPLEKSLAHTVVQTLVREQIGGGKDLLDIGQDCREVIFFGEVTTSSWRIPQHKYQEGFEIHMFPVSPSFISKISRAVRV